MNTKLIFPAVLLSAMTLAAHAGEGHKRHHNPDLNDDGVVSTAEMLEHRQAMFKKMDLNGDGFVTEAETAEMRAKMAAQRQKMHEEKAKVRFSKADLNGDGMISAEEFASEAEQKIKRLDANGDGEISRQEMRAAKREMRGA
ncbi:EF-hand domain-containing protein [Zhongshania sp.]|uniref:EF-hand domain-containing protein n=1 Tax=Zhongshania sp. TaxID=1971902 RepID=UPI003569F0A9